MNGLKLLEFSPDHYLRGTAEKGVLAQSIVYELVEEIDDIHYLVVRAARDNLDFRQSETQLDAKISSKRFEQIGIEAEAMISSFETISAVSAVM
jgi:hypothetical protein